MRVVSLFCPNIQITLQLITINDPPVKDAIRPRAQRLIATPIVPCATKYHDNERDTIANTNIRSIPSIGIFMKLSTNILGSWTQLALLRHDWLPFMILYGPRTFKFDNREVPPYPRDFSREAHVQTRDYVALNYHFLRLTEDSGSRGIV